MPSSARQRLLRELDDSGTSDDRRAEIGASLISMPAQRAAALSAIETMLAAPQSSDALKTRLLATLGNNAGADTDAAMIGALARTGSTPVFDQIVKRPESAEALLGAMKAGRDHPRAARARERRAAADAPEPARSRSRRRRCSTR